MKKETWWKVAAGSALILVLGVLYLFHSCENGETGTVSREFFSVSEEDIDVETTIPEMICYVTGCVQSPGIYHLPLNARIYELIEASGGFTDEADQIAVNLAEKLYDGAHVHVAAVGENAVPFSDGKMNINICSKEDLLSLPGIGEKKADAILSYREQNGFFSSIEDIMNVSGIGQSMFDEIKDYIKVQGR